MTCPKCNSSNIDGSTFCVGCGANLKENIDTNISNNLNNEIKSSMISNTTLISNNNYLIKEKSNNKKIITVIFLIAVCLLAGFFLYRMNLTNKTGDSTINSSTSFFLSNSDRKYALFNENGEQLTDFIYDDYEEFVNGHAVVEIDYDSLIIDDKGNVTIDRGVYSDISVEGGLFLARDENYKYYLIDGNNKVYYELSYSDSVSSAKDKYVYTVVENSSENKYIVLDQKGNEIYSFENDLNHMDAPIISTTSDYFTVFYNNEETVLSYDGKEIIATFSSEKPFYISGYSDDTLLLKLDIYSLGNMYESEFKAIKDNKVYDLPSTCTYSYMEDNNIICKNNSDDKYVLNSNFEAKLNLEDYKYNIIYKDAENYAVQVNREKVVFNYDGNDKEVNCYLIDHDTSGQEYAWAGMYLLRADNFTCKTDSLGFEYFHSDGTKAFEKSFAYAELFDENNLAIVSEDKENYYLIDVNGNKISDYYDEIFTVYDKYYKVKKGDKIGIINTKNEFIVPLEYSSWHNYSLEQSINNHYINLETSDEKQVIYDLLKKKEVFTVNNRVSFSDHYIIVEGDKYEYYTYSGKKFYEK